MAKTFKPGEKYLVVGEVQQPVLAEIFVLTTEPGKLIGVKLPYKLAGAHSLDGRVESGMGLWVHPQHLLTESEFKAQSLAKQSAQVPAHAELPELVFDEETHQVVLPE